MKQVKALVTYQVTAVLTVEIPDDQEVNDDLREDISEWPLCFTVNDIDDYCDDYALTEIYVMSVEPPLYNEVELSEVEVPA